MFSAARLLRFSLVHQEISQATEPGKDRFPLRNACFVLYARDYKKNIYIKNTRAQVKFRVRSMLKVPIDYVRYKITEKLLFKFVHSK